MKGGFTFRVSRNHRAYVAKISERLEEFCKMSYKSITRANNDLQNLDVPALTREKIDHDRSASHILEEKVDKAHLIKSSELASIDKPAVKYHLEIQDKFHDDFIDIHHEKIRQEVYVVYRQVSEYNSGTQHLGVFLNRKNAEYAMNEYINKLKSNPSLDEFAIQGYRTVDVEDDTRIKEWTIDNVNDLIHPGSPIYALFSVLEGFGQRSCNLESILSNESRAKRKYETSVEMESKSAGNNFPVYFTGEMMIEGKLQYRQITNNQEFINFLIPSVFIPPTYSQQVIQNQIYPKCNRCNTIWTFDSENPTSWKYWLPGQPALCTDCATRVEK